MRLLLIWLLLVKLALGVECSVGGEVCRFHAHVSPTCLHPFFFVCSSTLFAFVPSLAIYHETDSATSARNDDGDSDSEFEPAMQFDAGMITLLAPLPSVPVAQLDAHSGTIISQPVRRAVG